MDLKGLSIQGVADALKISYQAVKKVKNGGAFGRQNHLRAAKLLELNAEWLATGKGPQRLEANRPIELDSESKLESALDEIARVIEPLDESRRDEVASLLAVFARRLRDSTKADILAALREPPEPVEVKANGTGPNR